MVFGGGLIRMNNRNKWRGGTQARVLWWGTRSNDGQRAETSSKTHAASSIAVTARERDVCVWVHFDFGSAKLLSQPASHSNYNQNLRTQKHSQNTILITTNLESNLVNTSVPYCWCNKHTQTQTNTHIPLSDPKGKESDKKRKNHYAKISF